MLYTVWPCLAVWLQVSGTHHPAFSSHTKHSSNLLTRIHEPHHRLNPSEFSSVHSAHVNPYLAWNWAGSHLTQILVAIVSQTKRRSRYKITHYLYKTGNQNHGVNHMRNSRLIHGLLQNSKDPVIQNSYKSAVTKTNTGTGRNNRRLWPTHSRRCRKQVGFRYNSDKHTSQ